MPHMLATLQLKELAFFHTRADCQCYSVAKACNELWLGHIKGACPQACPGSLHVPRRPGLQGKGSCHYAGSLR